MGTEHYGLAAESPIEGESQHKILDGEIVCLNAEGKSQFNSLMYRRGTPYFYTFDLLQLNGEDLRSLPLATRLAAWPMVEF